MRTIGLIGGMSWESTVYYYTLINKLVNERQGGFKSAKIILHSVDFSEIQLLQKEGNWDKLSSIMVKEAKKIESSGADLLLICSNTMHITAQYIQNKISIPLIHIADPTGVNIKRNNITKIGLIGTKYTMEKDFYKSRLSEKYNLEVIIPEINDRNTIHDIIFNQLVFGKFISDSKKKIIKIINKLINNGAQGIILGCTEIPLLIKKEDVLVPVFDTTYLHAESSVNLAI